MVFKDLAQDLMGRITFESRGKKIPGADFYELLSLYDDFLTEAGVKGYEAGDTLALAIPHFLYHGLTDEDIWQEAKTAQVCLGVKEYLGTLRSQGWEIRVISTAYRPMWKLMGDFLKIPQVHIACTEINLKSLRRRYQSPKFNAVVKKMEEAVLSMLPQVWEMKKAVKRSRLVVEVFRDTRYVSLREKLDRFYWHQLKDLGYLTLKAVRVMGGKRKILKAREFAHKIGISLAQVAYVGDSIVDDQIHRYLEKKGGLPIAVNGDFYALRHAKVAVAAGDMRTIWPVLEAWSCGGMKKVKEGVKNQFKEFFQSRKMTFLTDERYYHLLEGASKKERQEILKIHAQFRQ